LRRVRALVFFLVTLIGLFDAVSLAAVLPEDRADVMYHSYSGDEVEVAGPSILVRKSLGNKVSFVANYYVDNITSASVDVVSQGSAYTEDRKEGSIGGDFLYEDATFSVGISNSEEDDYTADTYWFGLTQEFFGGLSTVSMGYARGADEVRRNGSPEFQEDVDRRSYRLGFTQILTKNSLIGMTWETIADKGYLNNPYRSYRFIDATSSIGYSYAPEIYPSTRTSNAISVRGKYYLRPRSSISAEYRYFNDDWNITAHNIEFGYARALGSAWLVEAGYRYYTQTGADFFSNLFAFEGEQNFMGRDKELSPFDSHTVRVGATYQFMPSDWWLLEKGTVNFYYDLMLFNYDEYTNNRPGTTLATEELFEFDAHVYRAYVSFWF
jgi:hypothetical protein